MQPFQINVTVNVGITEELKSFAAALFSGLAQNQATPLADAVPTKKAKTTKAQAPSIDDSTKEQEAQQEAPKPVAAKQEQEQEATKAKEYTAADVRAAMDRTRIRFEGEDYRNKPTSAEYQKWHNVLTTTFLSKSSELGTTKPSALPDSDSRAAFIAYCDSLQMGDNDELVEG